ncbi:hypothetical protein FJT64_025459 [Amphibalanus amphitrite]|uniref:Uncharacterized protein n=1 Tax=Amphibalanus amphitrite TaxID=1232801 RepID=A0A6A4W558_AMPAM|nr:hypothetical protein FJT64_025459 [Amphibalanus amphitrite]
MRFYWGNFEQGKIRTECSSTFVTNEPKSNALMLRAKTNVIGIVIIGKQGQWLQSAELTKYMIEMLQFNVRFVTRPQSKLKVLPNNDGKDSTNTTGTGTADGNTTVVGTDAAGASKLKLDEGDEMSIAFYGLLLLLILGACCAVLCLRSKRNKSETPSLDESSPEEESPMPSGSDSSGDDD